MPQSPPETRPLYVFGYGSLMWRPDFPFVRSAPALAHGFRRRLCVWSNAYRGSPKRPGLVFGLDRGPADRAAKGVLFEVAPRHRRATIAYLFRRELIYPIYEAATVEAEAEGWRARALTFLVDRDDPAYAGDLRADIRIAAIASGAGQAGRARDYLENALERLRQMDAPEPELEAELAAADRLADDPALLFSLLDEPMRRRLDLVFKPSHERPAVQPGRNRVEELDDDAAGAFLERVSSPEEA